ncbi:MAG: asparagine synthase C-terminal domain-containing protein, partial [bacterium]|nr:asparagine synthase C-terminal domain-containing protein [bacterium]
MLALFNRSTRRLLTGRSRPFLFLSGGIDSRVILGSLRETGFHLPAVTYGTQEGDDAPIARKLAEHCGLPFTFYPISTDDPQRHFADAALRSDCRAEMVDTPTHGPLLDQLSMTFDTFIQGDKSFSGHHATTPAEAFEQAGVISLAHAQRLSDMLEPVVSRHAWDSLEQTLRGMHAAGQSIDPQDLKDKIYYEQRLVNRQIAFTAANLRQFEQVRPWLDEDLVDFLFSTPNPLRMDKVCNKRMLEKAYPDLLSIPFAQRDSIPQSNFYRKHISANAQLAEFFRVQFQEALDVRLSGMFRPGSLSALIGSLASGAPYPMPNVRWWHRLPGLWKIAANR